MTILTPAQCRAARGLLDWTQDDLARAAQIAVNTLRNFEAQKSTLMTNNLMAVVAALEHAGVELIAANGGGGGVRLRDRE